jgi:hypothetical protein
MKQCRICDLERRKLCGRGEASRVSSAYVLLFKMPLRRDVGKTQVVR